MRPLDRLPSIKLKLGVVILAGVATTTVMSVVGFRYGWPIGLRPVIAAIVSIGLVQVLSRGMTSPLREMASAAQAMAKGDYGRRVTATSHDEVGDLARAFNDMAAELAEVDRMRRDLVANVSHELRTPLGALRATLENLVDGVEPSDEQALGTMLRQVDRLTRLVTQLLDLSRLESGVLALERRRFSVPALLDDAAAECRVHAPHVPVRVDVDPGLVADGDPERVHQVVANLLENAARFSPDGGTVDVLARADGRGVRIEVLDQGPGIADGDAERVFERFYRSDASRSTTGGGAGLGLAIARWIVDLHGGAIHAERREPTGCRIIVSLPEVTP
jgi:signal transduction histidine kinase